MRRRVVVTGLGCVTPVGNDVNTMWDSLRESRSGIGNITHFDAANFPTRIAAEVKGYDFRQYFGDAGRFAHAGRNIRFAIGAAHQAVQDAGLPEIPIRSHAVRGLSGSRRRPAGFPAVYEHGRPVLRGWRGRSGEVHRMRVGAAQSAGRIGTRTQPHRRPSGEPVSCPGAEPQLPDGVRGVQPGHR